MTASRLKSQIGADAMSFIVVELLNYGGPELSGDLIYNLY